MASGIKKQTHAAQRPPKTQLIDIRSRLFINRKTDRIFSFFYPAVCLYSAWRPPHSCRCSWRPVSGRLVTEPSSSVASITVTAAHRKSIRGAHFPNYSCRRPFAGLRCPHNWPPRPLFDGNRWASEKLPRKRSSDARTIRRTTEREIGGRYVSGWFVPSYNLCQLTSVQTVIISASGWHKINLTCAEYGQLKIILSKVLGLFT
ncbi:hypothetical protein GWI33_018641 [Rhynchophorus ferrugineus]|uniref:Uncharacterized protein n=1 Tax=Rhynchophorus ferrugineus TaxID=354439 RepID=A0A834HUG5_RHYFE|nr:hypothetical protein GWI33_018641 [Rhynchophorus ferrugineus]